MNSQLYSEIANTHLFEMEQSALMNHAKLFLTHYRSLTAGEKNRHPEESFFLKSSDGFKEQVMVGNAASIANGCDLEEGDRIINVINFSGPIMRSGGGCAYGSKELRERIIQAAMIPQCIGHIFIVDTPGGSSYSKYDFKEALDFVRSKKQLSAVYIDGMCCSAGMAWASLCQRIYARNEHCMVGCMGTYAAFYTNKDKDVNTITQEQFHIVYAEESSEKNKSFRDSAEGDDTLIQQEVDREQANYSQIIKAGLPNATAEQLKGGVWEAGEVVGTLVDGIAPLNEVVDWMANTSFEEAEKDGSDANVGNVSAEEPDKDTETPEELPDDKEEGKCSIENNAEEEPNKDEPADKDEPAEEEPKEEDKPADGAGPAVDDADKGDEGDAGIDDADTNTPDDTDGGEDEDEGENKTKKQNTMNKVYDNLRAALGEAELQSDKEDAVYLNAEQMEQLEAVLASKNSSSDADNAEKENAALKATIAENQKKLDELTAQLVAQNEKLSNVTKQLDELKNETAPLPQPAVTEPVQVNKEAEISLVSVADGVEAQREAYKKRMEMLKKKMK